jgi:periplasmic divalent cation tolerance protein
MNEYLQVVTTTASREDAQKIAETLIQDRLAACVQIIGPITSVYRWQGKIETSAEWQCVAKTRHALYGRLETAIRAVHAYQVPEILAIPVACGNAAYLHWLEDETSPE